MERLILWAANHLPRPLRNFYFRYESLILYVIFGGLTTLISLVAQFVPAYFLGTGKLATVLCTTISWICAVTFAFFTNKRYVFKSVTNNKQVFWKEFYTFYGARLVSFFLEIGIMLVFASWLGLNYIGVKFCAQILIMAANYVFSKLIIFRKQESNKQDGSESVEADTDLESSSK